MWPSEIVRGLKFHTETVHANCQEFPRSSDVATDIGVQPLESESACTPPVASNSFTTASRPLGAVQDNGVRPSRSFKSTSTHRFASNTFTTAWWPFRADCNSSVWPKLLIAPTSAPSVTQVRAVASFPSLAAYNMAELPELTKLC